MKTLDACPSKPLKAWMWAQPGPSSKSFGRSDTFAGLSSSVVLLSWSIQAAVIDRAPPPLPLGIGTGSGSGSGSGLACRPVGECEVCPDSLVRMESVMSQWEITKTARAECLGQMMEPACRVYGNRRLVHCLVLEDDPPQKLAVPLPSPPTEEDNHTDNENDNVGEHPHLLLPPASMAFDDSGQMAATNLPRRLLPRDSTVSFSAGLGGIQQSFSSWEPCARAVESERKDFWEFIVSFHICFPHTV